MNSSNDTPDSLDWKFKELPGKADVVEMKDVNQIHQLPSKIDEASTQEIDAHHRKNQSQSKSLSNSSSSRNSVAVFFLLSLVRYPRVSLATLLAGLFLIAWHFSYFQLLRFIVTTTPYYFLIQAILFVLYGHVFYLGRRLPRQGRQVKRPVGQDAAKATVFSMLVFAPMYLASAVLTVKNLGDADRFFQRGEYQRALMSYANLDKLLENEFYTLQQARCEEHLGKYQDAADIYSEKIRHNPTISLYTARATAFDKLGEIDQAKKDRNEANKLRKKLGDAASAQLFFDNRQLDEALQIYNQMVAQQPTSAKNYVLRAQCLYDLKRYSASVEDLNHAIVLYPKFGQAFYVRARAYEKLGKQDFAKRDRAEAAALHYRHYSE